jgi:hypothetical protein
MKSCIVVSFQLSPCSGGSVDALSVSVQNITSSEQQALSGDKYGEVACAERKTVG